MSLRRRTLGLLRCLNRVDEVFDENGFGQIGHAPDAHRGAARDVLIPRGDEDDRRRNPRGIQLSLQVDARKRHSG